MKRALFILVPILVLVLFWSISQMKATDDTFHITGKIMGADGNPPALAHVHLTKLDGSYRKPLQSEQVSENGKFSLELQEPGAYRVWITATDHRITDIPLILEPQNKKIEMDITLRIYDFKDTFDEVKIIGTWNDFKWQTAESMEKQEDGTFVFEPEVTADTIGYQLLGVVESGRSVNGTMADFFEYDGGGDYKSMLRIKNQKVKIVFDPSKLPKPKFPDLPNVVFDKNNRHLAELYQIKTRYEQQISDFANTRSAYEKEHGHTRGFNYDLSLLQSYLSEKMHQASHPVAQQAAAMLFARLYYYGVRLEEENYADILNTVPPESQMWVLSLRPIILGLALENSEKARSLLQSIYNQNPDKTIKAKALADLTSLTLLAGDQEKYKALFAELNSKFNDVSAIRFQLLALDPNSSIAWGKPVPDFEVKLLNSDKTISNKSLLGKFYLIDFWATWCGPCRREMPHLHEAYEEYKNNNFTILSLSLDSKPEDVQSFRKKGWEMPWLHAFIADGWKSEIVEDFVVNLTGIPSPFLISPDGRILATHDALRGEYLERTLEKYLGSN